MKIITQTRAIIEVQAQDLINLFVECSMDNMRCVSGGDGTDAEDLLPMLKSFTNDLQKMVDGDWAGVFRDGLAPLLLSDEALEFIDNHFHKDSSRDNIEIRVIKGDTTYTVKGKDINF